MYGTKLTIDYDKKRGRFKISGPPHLNAVVKSIPNRKWESNNKCWSAPSIRANIEYLLKYIPKSHAIYTEVAIVALSDGQARYSSKPKSIDSSFPVDYPFKTKPRAMQMEALRKVYGLKSIALFMDMRTGKTKVVIDMASALRMRGKADKVLIVAPLSIRKNWVREIETHAPFPIDAHVLDTGKPKDFDRWILEPHDHKWLLVGVESLAAGSAINYCKRFLLTGTKSIMVVDESSKIKNHKATRTKNCISLGRMAETRVIMTGTPTANGPMDLFSQFEFLDPDIIGMGDFYSFRNRYAVMGGYENKEIVGYANLDELMEIIEPFIYQVRKDEVFPDAPPKIYMRREVELNPEQKRLYKQVKKQEMADDGNKILLIQNSLEKMLRLQEITGGIISFSSTEEDVRMGKPKFYRQRIAGNNPKIAELMACLEEFDGPTIVWCAYKEEIRMVAEEIRNKYGEDQVVELHGDISEVDRDINVNVLFQGGKAKYLVGNAATGGMGLTMSAAEVEIYYSNSFNLIDRDQSEERAFGPDKKNGTMIIDIVASKTVDEHIVSALSEKKDIAEYVRQSITTLKEKIYGDL